MEQIAATLHKINLRLRRSHFMFLHCTQRRTHPMHLSYDIAPPVGKLGNQIQCKLSGYPIVQCLTDAATFPSGVRQSCSHVCQVGILSNEGNLTSCCRGLDLSHQCDTVDDMSAPPSLFSSHLRLRFGASSVFGVLRSRFKRISSKDGRIRFPLEGDASGMFPSC